MCGVLAARQRGLPGGGNGQCCAKVIAAFVTWLWPVWSEDEAGRVLWASGCRLHATIEESPKRCSEVGRDMNPTLQLRERGPER